VTIAFVVIEAFALVATGSRTSMLSAVAGVLVLAVWTGAGLRRRWLRLALPIAGGVALVGVLIAAFALPYAWWNTLLSDRLSIWGAASAHLFDYPLLGRGTLPLTDPAFAGTILATVPHAHDQFLQTTLESGLLGLAVLLAFLALTIRSLARTKHPLQIALFAALLIAALVEVPFSRLLLGSSFAVIFSVLLITAIPGKEPPSRHPRP
jgi:O-antigen ligase